MSSYNFLLDFEVYVDPKKVVYSKKLGIKLFARFFITNDLMLEWNEEREAYIGCNLKYSYKEVREALRASVRYLSQLEEVAYAV